MLSITTIELDALLATFLWPFSRILALITSAPIFSSPSIPIRVKLGFATVITILIAPTLKSLPAIDPGSGIGLLIIIQQVIIGLAIGLTMRIIFMAVEMAGEVIGLQMGLGFATFFDPQNTSQTPLISRFLGIIASLAFIAMNGHLQIITFISKSFDTLPIGSTGITTPMFVTLTKWGGEIFLTGLQLSLPVLTALLITNLALGILTRVAPQLNIFAVGFPLTLSIGFLVLALSIPFFTPILERSIQDGLNIVTEMTNSSHINAP
ncbi:flagellar biosynthetic protein FliR [Nitrosomonas cryotolerans]|uniref:Flagellar biosynthetic protein FliR n=1 Tax=Nitrosomonas cryotolerans ATCC 49181 TaxID=1131553 RepID=A0A1N6I5C4_9PROT|nr:flagellar biosynthetic protein FliR [Nitrosomonas cryotolerans]SFQ10631.1 flagellar biosynthetic protein FliR [Nitrosomonas cryotolerans]SIO27169.1 flagellar biosynthetic protein FliR [Nitrosomonas cryotolerans ATCC 49181]